MSEKMDNFCGELHTKLNDADKRLNELKANIKSANEKARNDAKAFLMSLDNKAQQQRVEVKANEQKMKDWLEEKKTMTSQKIEEWKSKRQLEKLSRRAERAEDYAVFTIQLAAAAVDDAESAIAEAIIDRMDADSVQAAAA